MLYIYFSQSGVFLYINCEKIKIKVHTTSLIKTNSWQSEMRTMSHHQCLKNNENTKIIKS